MTDSTLASAPSTPAEQFSATVNGKPLTVTAVTGFSGLRAELSGMRTRRIWNIQAVGQIARQRTNIGLFIDQVLPPGTYDLIDNERLGVVYHLTPRSVAKVYLSRDLQHGHVVLHECNPDTGRVRGTFEFGITAVGFRVNQGSFDLICSDEKPSAQ